MTNRRTVLTALAATALLATAVWATESRVRHPFAPGAAYQVSYSVNPGSTGHVTTEIRNGIVSIVGSKDFTGSVSNIRVTRLLNARAPLVDQIQVVPLWTTDTRYKSGEWERRFGWATRHGHLRLN